MRPTNPNKGRPSIATIDVPLECGCLGRYTRRTAPQTGDEVYCRKCSNYTTVVEAVADPFRVICNGCPFNRQYGDKLTALRKASSHLIRFGSHTLTLWKGDKEIDTLRNETITMVMTEEAVRNNRVHQSGLKNLGKSVVDVSSDGLL